MANFCRSVLALALLIGSSSLLAFEITGESFSVEGTVTGVELTADGGTINAVGNAGRYGKVFLTWNMTLNPNSDSKVPLRDEAWVSMMTGIARRVVVMVSGVGLEQRSLLSLLMMSRTEIKICAAQQSTFKPTPSQ